MRQRLASPADEKRGSHENKARVSFVTLLFPLPPSTTERLTSYPVFFLELWQHRLPLLDGRVKYRTTANRKPPNDPERLANPVVLHRESGGAPALYREAPEPSPNSTRTESPLQHNAPNPPPGVSPPRLPVLERGPDQSCRTPTTTRVTRSPATQTRS